MNFRKEKACDGKQSNSRLSGRNLPFISVLQLTGNDAKEDEGQSKEPTSGTEKEYEDKVKEKKKAEIEAKKEAIRQEDIAKGVYVPVLMLPATEPKKGVANT